MKLRELYTVSIATVSRSNTGREYFCLTVINFFFPRFAILYFPNSWGLGGCISRSGVRAPSPDQGKKERRKKKEKLWRKGRRLDESTPENAF